MDNGETIAQWRKLYFQKFGVGFLCWNDVKLNVLCACYLKSLWMSGMCMSMHVKARENMLKRICPRYIYMHIVIPEGCFYLKFLK